MVLGKVVQKIAQAADGIGRYLINDLRPIEGGRSIRDIGYSAVYTREQSLDIHFPSGEGPHPIVVYAHGGGWFASDKGTYSRLARLLSRRGYLVFNVNYRLLPQHKHPAQLQDITQALSWVWENAAIYGGDPSQIFLMGDSAGAQLMGWYATALRRPELLQRIGAAPSLTPESVRGVALIYGVYNFFSLEATRSWSIDFLLRNFFGAPAPGWREKATLASPLFQAEAGMPPLLLVAGEADRFYKQSVEFAQMLQHKGVPVETSFLPASIYPEARHAYMHFYYRRAAKDTFQRLVDFMEARRQRRKEGRARFVPKATNDTKEEEERALRVVR